MPVEAFGRVAQPQGIAGGQGVERQLQLLSLENGPGGEGPRAAGLVVNDQQAAVGGPIDSINHTVQPEAVTAVGHSQHIRLEEAGLEAPRHEALGDLDQRLQRLADLLLDFDACLSPPRCLPESLSPRRCVQDAPSPGLERGPQLIEIGGIGHVRILVHLFQDAVIDAAQLSWVQPLCWLVAGLQSQHAADEKQIGTGAVGLQATGTPGVMGTETAGEVVGQCCEITVERAGRIIRSRVEEVGCRFQRCPTIWRCLAHPFLERAILRRRAQPLHDLGPGGSLVWLWNGLTGQDLRLQIHQPSYFLPEG